jgi:hypothetical protein
VQRKKIASKFAHFCNFQKNAQSKQPPNRRKFAQSGHPAHNQSVKKITGAVILGTALINLSRLHRHFKSIVIGGGSIQPGQIFRSFTNCFVYFLSTPLVKLQRDYNEWTLGRFVLG